MIIFDAFRKKDKTALTWDQVPYEYQIKCNMISPTKLYDISSDEDKFVKELLLKSKNVGLSPEKFSFTRLSNGTINVDYDYLNNGGFVGKVKLQGRKTYIMYMKNLYDTVTVNGNADECLKTIDNWITYIKKYFK